MTGADSRHVPDEGTVWSHVERQYRERPDDCAIVFEDRQISFSELRNRSIFVAEKLNASGIEANDVVAAWCKNRPEFLYIYAACGYLGCCFAPINSRFRWGDARDYIEAVGAEVLFFDGDLAKRRGMDATGSSDESRRHEIDTFFAGVGSEPSVDRVLQLAREITPDAELLITSTSGTTGEPKIMVYDHTLLIQQGAVIDWLSIDSSDRILFQVPMYYAPGVQIWLPILLMSGMSMVLLPEFDSDRALDAIEKYGCTLIHGMDTHYVYLCDAQEEKPRRLESLRTGYFAPMFTPEEDIDRALTTICSGLVTVYGMTESSGTISCTKPEDSLPTKARTAGRPVSAWTEVRSAEDGEILLRGPFLFKRFLHLEPGEAKDEDGWYATGDLGYLDGDGRVVLTGRKKDVIRVGGEQVTPPEVEAVIRHTNLVRQAKVIGVPDDVLGEIPIAAVIPWSGEAVDEEAILSACRRSLPRWKIPRHIVSMDEFPMTTTDKIRASELRREVIDQLGLSTRRRMYEGNE